MISQPSGGTAVKRFFEDLVSGGLQLSPESVPLRERVLDRLADLMFCADDVLEMLSSDPSATLRACEKPVRSAYDSINSLMKTLCD